MRSKKSDYYTQFTSTFNNVWLVGDTSHGVESRQMVVEGVGDLTEGHVCLAAPGGNGTVGGGDVRVYCIGKCILFLLFCCCLYLSIGGAPNSIPLSETDNPLFSLSLPIPSSTPHQPPPPIHVTRFGYTDRSGTGGATSLSRFNHAAVLLSRKIYLFGGLRCRFCGEGMWGVGSTGLFDLGDATTVAKEGDSVVPTFQWIEGGVDMRGVVGNQMDGQDIEVLSRFAGSCAVAVCICVDIYIYMRVCVGSGSGGLYVEREYFNFKFKL